MSIRHWLSENNYRRYIYDDKGQYVMLGYHGLEYTAGDLVGYTVQHTAPKTQFRSRSKHSPGSGNYLNRIATGGSRSYDLGGRKVYLSYDDYFDANDSYSLDGHARWHRALRSPNWAEGYVYHYWRTERWVLHYRGFFRNPKEPMGVTSTGCSVKGWMCEGDLSFDTRSEAETARDTFISKCLAATDDLLMIWYDPSPYTQTFNDTMRTEGKKADDVVPKLDDSLTFWHELILLGLDPFVKSGIAHAYLDAVDKLPTLSSMNNIQNVLEVFSTIKDLSQGKITSIGSWRDAWLGYRYSYGTTKADIEEIADITTRLASLPTTIRSNGFVRQKDCTFRCSLKLDSDELRRSQSQAERYGFKLDAYKLWDMVPYSFVADWFVDVGGTLEFLNTRKLGFKLNQNCWFSVQRTFTNMYGFREIYYYRFYGSADPSGVLSNYSTRTSKKTIVKRVLDALALFG